MKPQIRPERPNRFEKIMAPGFLGLVILIAAGFVLALTAAPLTLAQSGNDAAPPANAVLGEGNEPSDFARERQCIHVNSINGFSYIDDQHLTVRTGVRREYLVTLWSRCRDLKWAHQIAIKSTSSWTCSSSRDMLIVRGQRCLIDNIERVDSTEAARKLVADRREKPDFKGSDPLKSQVPED